VWETWRGFGRNADVKSEYPRQSDKLKPLNDVSEALASG